jgi:lipopolysaccharide transport system ATP-binding protein
MNGTVIEVDDIWKKYRLGVIGTGTLRHDFERWWHRIRGKPDPHTTVGENESSDIGSQSSDNGVPHGNGDGVEELSADEIWALRGVSFEVKQGEILGTIGRNGAGKSTLLKILSRVTSPTKGEVRIKGRIASLLEIGTGFHPELTGRDNIFLNGAILGMTHSETKKKFDEIVAFAGIETYIDTPVKRYSSGMYVRLAFAVAAHLEAEILIIDEVLAVGDAQFQRKCLGKMKDVTTREGRTVIFVSHNANMITLLCDRAVYLDAGQVAAIAPASEAVTAYYAKGDGPTASKDFTRMPTFVGDDYVQLLECYVKNAAGTISPELDIQDSVIIGLRYKILQEKQFSCAFPYSQLNLYSASGELIFQSMTPRGELKDFSEGEYTAECEIPAHFLNNETYYIGLGMATCEDGLKVHFFENNVLRFQIKERMSESLYQTRNGYSGPITGVLRPALKWRVQRAHRVSDT